MNREVFYTSKWKKKLENEFEIIVKEKIKNARINCSDSGCWNCDFCD